MIIRDAPAVASASRITLLVGGGPSHAGVDPALLAGVRFVALNSACRVLRRVATADDVLYFADDAWARAHSGLIADWPGPVATSNRNALARLGAAVRRVDLDEIAARVGTDRRVLTASSGHAAAALLAFMGATRIVLIGFECMFVDGRSHGHGDYANDDDAAFRERFLPGWRALAPALLAKGVEIVNATPVTAIPPEIIPPAPLADALRSDRWA